MTASRTSSLQGRVICPVSGPPVEWGVVEIDDGLIVDIHDRPHARTVDLGNVAILPGLVNCHTHLEFSNLERPLGPAKPFAGWIASVVAERRRRCRLDEDVRAERDPIARGLEECFLSGSSLVGEIATGSLSDADDGPLTIEHLREGRLLPFREVLSPTPAGVQPALHAADSFLQRADSAAGKTRAGMSPHAPYTVTDSLLDACVESTVAESRPLAMHIAETLEEIEFLNHRTGPLAEMLQRIGQWDPGAIRWTRPLDVLKVLSRGPRVLVVHGNYLSAEELQFLAASAGMSLVYCPRTHAFFQHSRYPLVAALQSGVNVALGTDSRASNPDLNLWEEAKEVARAFPEVDPDTIVRMATANGAEALGQSLTHGVLERGRQADLCCVQLDSALADPVRAALGPKANVIGAMHSGEWIHDPLHVRG